MCLTTTPFLRCVGSSVVYLYGSLHRALSGVEIAPRGCHVGGCFSMLFILRANSPMECDRVTLVQTATESQPPTFSKEHIELARQEAELFDAGVDEWRAHPLATFPAWKALIMPPSPLSRFCPRAPVPLSPGTHDG